MDMKKAPCVNTGPQSTREVSPMDRVDEDRAKDQAQAEPKSDLGYQYNHGWSSSKTHP